MNLVEQIQAAKESGDVGAIVGLIPYCNFLGVTAEPDGDSLVVKLEGSENNVGNAALPALHGGTIGALLESAALFEVLWRAETVVLPKTVTLTIEYLRSAKVIDTFAKAHFTRQGRRVVNVRVEAWQDDPSKPIAAASVHVLLTPPEDA